MSKKLGKPKKAPKKIKEDNLIKKADSINDDINTISTLLGNLQRIDEAIEYSNIFSDIYSLYTSLDENASDEIRHKSKLLLEKYSNSINKSTDLLNDEIISMIPIISDIKNHLEKYNMNLISIKENQNELKSINEKIDFLIEKLSLSEEELKLNEQTIEILIELSRAVLLFNKRQCPIFDQYICETKTVLEHTEKGIYEIKRNSIIDLDQVNSDAKISALLEDLNAKVNSLKTTINQIRNDLGGFQTKKKEIEKKIIKLQTEVEEKVELLLEYNTND
ncbi:MAG: hypothetical protein INQ03_06245 [Candidatus Heimdallarchaeota archaeon]|nr:hypothetical protein [Candidatus Heimdallarchaeota archaeon]